MNIADIEPAADYDSLRRQFLSLRMMAVSLEQRSEHYRGLVDRSNKTASEVMAERHTNELLTNALLDAETSLSEHERLLWGAMHNLHGSRRNTLPRWSLVRDTFGCGSGVATALCRRFNLDPDEVLKN